MKDSGFLDISIYQIKLFLLLAEHLSFTEVAALTNITQPTLSKRISQMEQMLGVRLFDRDKRPIELTREARMLYDSWSLLCRDFEKAVNDMESLCKDDSRVINIASADSGNELLSLAGISILIQEKFPMLEINQQYLSFSSWRQKLLSREIDVMFTTLLDAQNLDSALTWKQITTIPKEVCMLVTNPLAQKESVTFEDLQDQKFVSISPMESMEYYKYIRTLCIEHGFEPFIVRYASKAGSLLSSLIRNDEVVICDAMIRDINSKSIRRFPLPGVESGLIAVWRKDNHKIHLQDVIDVIKTESEENVRNWL